MSGQLFCCFGFIWGGIDVEQTREETYSCYIPPGEHFPRLGIKGIQYSLSGETLPTGQASFKESRWHMWQCFPAWECVAPKEWIILASSPADDFPNESLEKTPPSLSGQHELGLFFQLLQETGSHIKSFAPPKKLLATITVVSCFTTGQ